MKLSFTDILLIGFTLIVPIFRYLPRLPYIDANPIRILGIGLCCCGIYHLFRFRHRLRRIEISIMLFWLALIFRTTTSFLDTSIESVLNETFSIHILMAVLASYLLTGTCMTLKTYCKVIIISSIIACILSAGSSLKIIGPPSYANPSLIYIFTWERTAWAVDNYISVLAILACCHLLRAAFTSKDIAFALAGICLSFANLMLGEFRSYILLSLLLSMAYLVISRSVSIKSTALILFFILSLVVATMLHPVDRISEVLRRFSDSTDTSALSYTGRVDERNYELWLIGQQPVFGYGFGLGSKFSVGLDVDSTAMPMYGHNLYTSFVARAGIPLGSAFILMWLLLGWLCFKKFRETTDTEVRDALLIAALLAWSPLIAGPVLNLFTMTMSFPCAGFFIGRVLASSGRDGAPYGDKSQLTVS